MTIDKTKLEAALEEMEALLLECDAIAGDMTRPTRARAAAAIRATMWKRAIEHLQEALASS